MIAFKEYELIKAVKIEAFKMSHNTKRIQLDTGDNFKTTNISVC